ncbi:hypothetical protein GXN78_40340 (plasmid) [Variovorax sp. WS11]|nr:hypothetical protein [Variovorax sp. WS11]
MRDEEADVLGDAGYQEVVKCKETQGIKARWHVAIRLGKRRALDTVSTMSHCLTESSMSGARMRAKVEHPFRVIKLYAQKLTDTAPN